MTIVIGEISGNHGGDLNKAKELICAAKYSGCDMVKFQAYTPKDMPDYDENAEMYEKLAVPVDWYGHLFATAKRMNIPLFASVFSVEAIGHLQNHNPAAYKIASPESTRLSDEIYGKLVTAIRASGKQFIASSGRKDVTQVANWAPNVLLYCVAGYPATIPEGDLLLMEGSLFQGFSDHTVGLSIPLVMITVGAAYIEKHFKIDEDCVDAAFSLTPWQMQTLCRLAHR